MRVDLPVILVLFGICVGGCSRGKPEDEKAQSKTGTQGKTGETLDNGAVVLSFNVAVNDKRGIYDGRLAQTTGEMLSMVEQDKTVVIRLSELGSPPDMSNLFCILEEKPAVIPTLGQKVTVRGYKRGAAFSACSIVADAGR